MTTDQNLAGDTIVHGYSVSLKGTSEDAPITLVSYSIFVPNTTVILPPGKLDLEPLKKIGIS